MICRAALSLFLAVSLTACAGRRVPLPAPSLIAEPDPANIESVVFLAGDAGEANRETHPILTRLQQDVEYWSERVPGDSSVMVLYLGDIVYPLGVNPIGTPDFPGDSAIVHDQTRVVAGPNALAGGARGYFLAGNHDWGLEDEYEGFVRLASLSQLLANIEAETGAYVRLAPEAGSGGPMVVDLGRHLRILMLDTAWWVLDGGQLGAEDYDDVLGGIRDALTESGEREVIVAAHHPFRSAGTHGGQVPFWRTLGVRYLLTRSGAMLQDLTSLPYRELENGLRSIFSTVKAPLIFAGGHEHNLQIFETTGPSDPQYSIVSGSASKLSPLGSAQPGMQFGSSTPGYMRVLVERGGGVTIAVESAPEQYLKCQGTEEQIATCVGEGIAAFQTIHSQRLK